jgi:uncharacterized protein YyaL (SSP411 family)
MTSPDGAFYTAEDADSEGEEGKFYTWDPGRRSRQVLGALNWEKNSAAGTGLLRGREFRGQEYLKPGPAAEALITASGDPREEDQALAGAYAKGSLPPGEDGFPPTRTIRSLTFLEWSDDCRPRYGSTGFFLSPEYLEAAARALEFICDPPAQAKRAASWPGTEMGKQPTRVILDDYAALIWAPAGTLPGRPETSRWLQWCPDAAGRTGPALLGMGKTGGYFFYRP